MLLSLVQKFFENLITIMKYMIGRRYFKMIFSNNIIYLGDCNLDIIFLRTYFYPHLPSFYENL